MSYNNWYIRITLHNYAENNAVMLQVELSYTSTYVNNISVTYYSAKTIMLQSHSIFMQQSKWSIAIFNI